MSYSFADSLRAKLYDIYHCCVQWKTPDDGQRNYPKHVEFYSKNKFKELVHLVGFVIRFYHDAQSPERQIGKWYFYFQQPNVRSSEKYSHLKFSQNLVGSTDCALLDLCYEDECMANYPIAAVKGFSIRKVVDVTATGRLKSKFVWRQEAPPVSTTVLNNENR